MKEYKLIGQKIPITHYYRPDQLEVVDKARAGKDRSPYVVEAAVKQAREDIGKVNNKEASYV